MILNTIVILLSIKIISLYSIKMCLRVIYCYLPVTKMLHKKVFLVYVDFFFARERLTKMSFSNIYIGM